MEEMSGVSTKGEEIGQRGNSGECFVLVCVAVRSLLQRGVELHQM